MTPASDVLAILREHRPRLAELGVTRIALFGSCARGDATSESDVDVLVDLDRRTFDRFMDVKLYLEDLLGRRVDLVLFDRIKPELRERILAEMVDAA